MIRNKQISYQLSCLYLNFNKVDKHILINKCALIFDNIILPICIASSKVDVCRADGDP